MSKKIIALILAVLVAALAIGFAGCKNKDAETPSENTGAESTSALADSDFAYIKGKGNMVIGITYFAPMNYLDENNELVGFETEFAKAVCERLGVEAKFQEISWAAKETELAAKNIDCIWNGMTINDERLANMSISTPYMANKQVLVVKADRLDEIKALESAKGLNIVAEKESAGETVATKEVYFSEANFTAVDTQAKALMEVMAGTADGCVVDYVCTIGMIGEGTDFATLTVVDGLSFADEEYGIAFRKGGDTVDEVNKVISELVADGTLNTIATKYKLAEQIIAK